MSRALAGQANVNSTERRTPRGTSERGMGLNPKRGKKRSAVSVSSYASSTSRLRVSSRAASVSRPAQPPAQPGTAEIPPHGDRPQQSRGSVKLEGRAPHDASLQAGHMGGREVVLKPVLREAVLFE